MKVLIVEDEDLAASQLASMLNSLDQSIQITSILKTIEEFDNWAIKEEHVDLIFCDIELRDGNILSHLKNHQIQAAFVFTTAYDQYWNAALQHYGIDYLLKPLNEAKLKHVLTKIMTLKKLFGGNNEQLLKDLSNYLETRMTANYKKRFPVRINNEVFILGVEEIMFFKIRNGVVFAHIRNGKHFPMNESTLNELENALDPQQFFRINRSELVHIKYIEAIQMNSTDDYYVKLTGYNENLIVSASRISQLKSWINL